MGTSLDQFQRKRRAQPPIVFTFLPPIKERGLGGPKRCCALAELGSTRRARAKTEAKERSKSVKGPENVGSGRIYVLHFQAPAYFAFKETLRLQSREASRWGTLALRHLGQYRREPLESRRFTRNSFLQFAHTASSSERAITCAIWVTSTPSRLLAPGCTCNSSSTISRIR